MHKQSKNWSGVQYPLKASRLGAFCPLAKVCFYLEFKLCHLKNLKLFSIWVKELFEPIGFAETRRRVFALLKNFCLRNRSLSNASWFYGKNKNKNTQKKNRKPFFLPNTFYGRTCQECTFFIFASCEPLKALKKFKVNHKFYFWSSIFLLRIFFVEKNEEINNYKQIWTSPVIKSEITLLLE